MRASSVGLGLAVLSAGTFGTSGSFAAALMAAGWSPAGAVAARIAIAALVLTVPAVLQLRGRWQLLAKSWALVAVYGVVAVGGAQLFYFNAVEHLSVGVALLLEYSGTLLVVGWMWLRHAQRPGRLTTFGGLLAIAGLVFVLDLTGAQRVDGVGVLWGLAAAAGLAVYFVVSAHADAELPPLAMAWAGLTVGSLVLGVAGATRIVRMQASTADTQLAGHRTSWLVPVAGLAIVAAVIAYSAGIAAARRLGARLASFVGLAEVLSAVLFAWLLLDQRPGGQQIVGGVLVLAGIALVRSGEPAADPGVSGSPGDQKTPGSALIAAETG